MTGQTPNFEELLPSVAIERDEVKDINQGMSKAAKRNQRKRNAKKRKGEPNQEGVAEKMQEDAHEKVRLE